MAPKIDPDEKTVDQAARAGWMYYLAGMTQDQIARELGVSRQRAQRLVARAMADGLIRVRLEHPIASCLALERELKQKFGLQMARVAPSLPEGVDPLTSVAPVAAKEVERYLSSDTPLVISLGTGRTLRAVVADMADMNCPEHKLVSLIGNAAPDGSASVYEVILRLADRVKAKHFPMGLPVFSKNAEEREFYRGLAHMQTPFELARNSDVTFVGIGQIGEDAPLFVDGFVDRAALDDLLAQDAVGEIVGWVFDSNGHYLEGGTNARTNGVQVNPDRNPVICIAAGKSKYMALKAALKGKLVNGLVTDEACAQYLLG